VKKILLIPTPLLFNIKSIFLFLVVIISASDTNAQMQSALPIEAYGVWDRSPVSLDDDTYLHLFKGLQLGYNWSDIEPVNDVFDWSLLDREILFAYDNNLYCYLSVNPGPDCPDWVYNTVPKMLTNDDKYDGVFPYYYHEDYIRHYYDMISNLAVHIASLDPALREKIAFLQVKTACTGDEKPVYGDYLPESPYKLYIDDPEWQEFRIAAFQHHKEKFVDAGLGIPLLFNNIDSDVDIELAAWTWVRENIGTGFGLKGSAYVRGHHLTGEGYFKNTWYDNLVNPTTLALFSRAEMDQTHTKPLYLINKPLGFYWGVLSGLNTGLSVFDITATAVYELSRYPDIIPSLEFFNRYAPEIYPATTKGAYSVFHEGLNSEDIVKFPESVYGTAAKTNEQRYINICAAYAHRGAQMDDPYSATMGQVYQRSYQTGYNDAGWDIERWIEQIDPDGTSIGLFRLNADEQGLLDENNSIYDRFARSFENSTGRDTMFFKFHEDVFSETAGQPDIITFEVTWLDKLANSTWELKYDAGEGNIKTAYAATGIGDNKWKTKTIVLSDAVLNNNCPRGADFMLVNTDDTDDIFHGFEVVITRKKKDEDPNSDTRLSDLKVNGETIRRFSPDTKIYNVELPLGTSDVPAVTATAVEPGATINIVDAESLPGSTTINVTAKDGLTTATYTIYLTVVMMNDFVTITSPEDGDEFFFGQAVTVTTESYDNDGIDKLRFNLDGVYTNVDDPPFEYTFNDLSIGTHTVSVQMKDLLGNRINTDPLTITVIPDPASDATLSDLLVDGSTVEGFSTDTEVYNIELPFGTTVVPEVTATSTNTNASVDVSSAPDLPGTTSVLVTAEDGVTTRTYTINFMLAPASTDATLSDLTVNHTTVADFSPDKEVYDIELPEGTTDVPVVTATAADENADVQVTDAANLPGSTTVLVTAEDGVSTKTYTINFYEPVLVRGMETMPIRIYPNPARDHISIKGIAAQSTITIFNMYGSKISMIENRHSEQIEISIPDLSPGVYFVQVQNKNDFTLKGKFVKE